MTRTELLTYLQTDKGMTAKEVEKIKNDKRKLTEVVFRDSNLDRNPTEFIDGIFGGNLSEIDFLEYKSKAVQITTDGVVMDITPENGKNFDLKEMYRYCDTNMVEIFYLANNRIIIMDEEGRLKPCRKINWLATKIVYDQLSTFNTRMEPFFIFGNVMIVNSKEVK